MKKVFSLIALVCAGMIVSNPLLAEEPESAVSLSFGADVVSSYIWRGQECGGFSVQPSATLTWNKPGVSLNAWTSAELFESGQSVNMTEFDLSLAWAPVEAFSIGLTDYYFCDGGYFSRWRWNANASHILEANVSYDFGPLALAWNTLLCGPDYNDDGDRCYSSYVEVSAPWKLSGIEGSVAVGASVWNDAFTAVGNDKLNVCNVSLTANKELFKLPFMGQIVVNPQTDNVYFVVGVSF